MKIFRLVTMAVTRNDFKGQRNAMTCFCVSETSKVSGHTHTVFGKLQFRGALLREDILTDKQVAKLLPAWAKPHRPRSIGDKVTAFYKANDRVVTGLHHSGFIVGSDEFYEWQETQPDCFRQTRDYLQNKYEHRI